MPSRVCEVCSAPSNTRWPPPLCDKHWFEAEARRVADAGEGTRTPTSLRSPALEAGASTSSATPANEEANP